MILLSVAAHYDLDHWIDMMGKPDLLKSFASIIQACPYAITVSEVKSNATVFPVIYANDETKKVTGYSPSYFAGDENEKNKKKPSIEERDFAKMFFGTASEIEQTNYFRAALQTATPCKIGVTCHKRNGSKFTNMIATLPLSHIDRLHEYRYVLGIHHNYSIGNTSGKQLQDIEDLLSLCLILMRCRRTASPSRNPSTADTILTRINSCGQLIRQLSGLSPHSTDIKSPTKKRLPKSNSFKYV